MMTRASLPGFPRSVEEQIRRAGLPPRDEARIKLALLMRTQRHRKGWTQEVLAKRVGKPVWSLRWFEGAGLGPELLRALDDVARDLARRPNLRIAKGGA